MQALTRFSINVLPRANILAIFCSRSGDGERPARRHQRFIVLLVSTRVARRQEALLPELQRVPLRPRWPPQEEGQGTGELLRRGRQCRRGRRRVAAHDSDGREVPAAGLLRRHLLRRRRPEAVGGAHAALADAEPAAVLRREESGHRGLL